MPNIKDYDWDGTFVKGYPSWRDWDNPMGEPGQADTYEDVKCCPLEGPGGWGDPEDYGFTESQVEDAIEKMVEGRDS
jgi:hypothetical protein